MRDLLRFSELPHDGCPVACVDDAPFGYTAFGNASDTNRIAHDIDRVFCVSQESL